MTTLSISAENFSAYSKANSHYAPANYGPSSVAVGRPLPYFGGSGTGGTEDVRFILLRQRYSPFTVVNVENPKPVEAASHHAPFADLMKNIQSAFGRTMSQLPAVFGVSRQTLYNWLDGELPRDKHKDKIIQLAAAANVFAASGFKPTSLALERTVMQGKSFIALIGEGADGKEMAERLVQIEKRAADSRSKLNALIGEKTVERPHFSAVGRPSLNENI